MYYYSRVIFHFLEGFGQRIWRGRTFQDLSQRWKLDGFQLGTEGRNLQCFLLLLFSIHEFRANGRFEKMKMGLVRVPRGREQWLEAVLVHVLCRFKVYLLPHLVPYFVASSYEHKVADVVSSHEHQSLVV